MKKILLIATCTLLLLSLFSCGEQEDTEHVHEFSCRVANEDTLAEEANCQFAASYHFSCECGELDIENYFTEGEPLSHSFDSGICIHCGEDDPDFFDKDDPDVFDEDGPIELPTIPVG